MNNAYSDLYEDSVENLGTQGYCDLVADVLREFHPDAHTYRITNTSGNRFAHVFLMLGNTALDITGATSIDKILARYTHVECAIADPTTPEAVTAFFLGHGREPKEHDIVTTRFRDHISSNPQQFLLSAW
ncbi:MAG: hypothetical protein K9N47_19370 [Prosthecobacter sp.]|uniref:hypothetical protein n=1 Tax=Prosthecobacter sp. TaxID=1965333 RepID=UPI0025ED434D|nr:hypothetical protein [Prosthecobacter sp.]MCF7788292.1 hypothetical protein [Prosthecobacter sp.]